MVDFQFLQNPLSKKWVVLAPRRAKRPDVAKGTEPVCPFCPGREGEEEEVYRIPPVIPNSFRDLRSEEMLKPALQRGEQVQHDKEENWRVRVVPNKFPFAPIHEIIIHSPDHHKNFGELPVDHTAVILQAYRQRFNTHKDKGQVYIFHNRGEGGGESLPHPHSQLAVVPFAVKMDIPRLLDVIPNLFRDLSRGEEMLKPALQRGEQVQHDMEGDTQETANFVIFCPKTSQWPDEVWIAPKNRGRAFGEVTDEEIADLAFALTRLVQIMDLRHGREFAFNFYIYPGGDWYLRLMPRTKTLGGFEVGTGIFVNTQDPTETMQFIKTHFENPDEEKIKSDHQAQYGRTA